MCCAFENDAHKPNVINEKSESVLKIVFKIKNKNIQKLMNILYKNKTWSDFVQIL
jgi:hypothetical protein